MWLKRKILLQTQFSFCSLVSIGTVKKTEKGQSVKRKWKEGGCFEKYSSIEKSSSRQLGLKQGPSSGFFSKTTQKKITQKHLNSTVYSSRLSSVWTISVYSQFSTEVGSWDTPSSSTAAPSVWLCPRTGEEEEAGAGGWLRITCTT